MDQHSTTDKAQDAADTSNLDMFSHPHSLAPHHRQGHRGGHRHHEPRHHGTSHHIDEFYHQGLPHHHGGSQYRSDLHDNIFSRHSVHSHDPHHREAHHHGRTRHATSSGLTPSHGTVLSRHSQDQDYLDDEHHHGSRRHHSRYYRHAEAYHHIGPPHHAEADHQGGSPHRAEAHDYTGPRRHGGHPHHAEADHHGGHHHHSRPHHHGGPHHHAEADHHGGHRHHGGPDHHAEADHHGGHHHHGGPNHHAEADHHGGHRHHAEADHHGGHHHHGGPDHHTEADHHGGHRHHAEVDHHGGHHHHGGPDHHAEADHHGGHHHHGRPNHQAEADHHGEHRHHAEANHHGGHRHHGGPDHHAEADHHGGHRHHGGPDHHTEADHHGGHRHHGGPDHHAEADHHGGHRHHGGPDHHAEADHHGGHRHHGGHHHHHGEIDHHGGLHHPGETHDHSGPHHHAETHHHGGHHRQDESNYREFFPSDHDYYREAYHEGGPHRYASQYGGHHHHEAHYRRPPYHGETALELPYMEPYQYGVPQYHSHQREHHHREHHHREHHYAPYYPDYLYHDLYEDHHHIVPGVFSSYKPHSMTRTSHGSTHSRKGITAHVKSSAFNLDHSLSATHPRVSKISSKVHPQKSTSKSLEDWSEDDEQFQKRKTILIQRSHKKHTMGLCYWLWEKLSDLFQELRAVLRKLTESLAFEVFIIFIIFLNTIMLVAQTFAEVEVRGEWYFLALDSVFLCVYLIEAVLKIIVQGFKYFFDSWNKLDFLIVVMAVVDFLLLQFNAFSTRSVYNQSIFRILKVFKSLRALRAFRVLRRLRFLTSLQEVTGTLARSLPSITAILILMFTCLFLFSVVLRALFHQHDRKRFQDIFTTIFTLFTLLTLDDWSLIYLDSRAQGAWYIIPILMIYIIIQYFIFLNLVIAVLVDNFQMALLKGLEKVKQEKAAQIHERLLEDSLTELSREPVEVLSEITRQKQLLEKKLGTLTEKQQELLFQFLQLAAAVEHHQQKFRSQAAVIDEIVDTAFEAGEEDFRK